MTGLNLSDNIIHLRRKKGITQEALAHFIGVTKASVSKWETKQSLPDIMLLPKLAAFFDVTVDELI
ncbi:helix-turn-helix domain-containing protein [Pradoshia sp.]